LSAAESAALFRGEEAKRMNSKGNRYLRTLD
jgi:hypothetical protein